MPYFSLFVLAQQGVGPEQLGFIISLRAVGTAAIAPMAGYLADSLGRKKIIFIGTAGHAASYLFYFAAHDLNLIVIGSLIEGLSVVHMPALSAITQDSIARNRRGVGLSATTGLQALPTLVSPLIGGVLAEQMGIDAGMRIGFALAFVVGLVVATIRLRFLRETVDRTAAPIKLRDVPGLAARSYHGMFSLLREYQAIRGLAVIGLVDTFFTAVTSPFWVVYAEEAIGITTAEWGLIETIVAAVNITALIVSGNLVDRFGRKRLILANLALAPVTNLSFIFCRNFSQTLLFRVVLTLQGAFIMPATTALMADIIPRKDRGRAIAALGWQPIVVTLGAVPSGFFRFLPFFAGSALSGYIYDLNPAHAYPWMLLAMGYVLELALCLLIVKEPDKPEE